MTAGVRKLSKFQLGRESVAGSAVAASTILRAPYGTLEDKREVVFDPEDVGLLLGTDRTHTPRYLAELGIPAAPATYEQLPHILEMGIKAATATQDGAGSGYIYAYPFGNTASNTIKTYTIEGGDNISVEEVEYCHVPNFSLSGKAGEALMREATAQGRQATVSAFTGALSLPTVEDILFSKGKLYIDAVGGTIGSTQKTNTLLEMKLDFKTGLMPVWTADGSLYFSFVKDVGAEITGDLTFEHDAISDALRVDWRAETTRLLRLKFEGAAVTTPGTTYSVKTLIIDMAAKIESVSSLGEQNGNNVLNIKWRARYNGTAAIVPSLTVVNELSALP